MWAPATPSGSGPPFWRGRARRGVPVGLGARDTLRLEMAYALYGNDIDVTTNPLEAGLGWVVKPAKGEFIGRSALERVRAEGPTRKLVGLEMTERAVARHGYPVVKDGRPSACHLGLLRPVRRHYIALAYVATPHVASAPSWAWRFAASSSPRASSAPRSIPPA